MKLKHVVMGGALVASAALIALAPTHRIAPNNIYPDPTLSPGMISTSDYATLTETAACGTYSKCHRNTTSAQKTQVKKEYPNCPAQQEIDHIVPLALGGADDVKNLWCQPEVNMWNGQDYGFHTKDRLEAYLVIQMKAQKITPQDAQKCILLDWVACYQKYITPQKFGSLILPDDPDA